MPPEEAGQLNTNTEAEGAAEELSLINPEEGAPENPEAGNEDPEKGAQDPGQQQEDPATEPTLEEKYAELQRNYQRLERKLTRVTQQSQGSAEAVNLYNFIAQRPELAAQVNQLLQAHGGTEPADQYTGPQFDPAAERAAMKELLGRADFVKHEQEIAEWAEDNGLPFESALDQKRAYMLWRGENADRLIQEARMQGAKKAVQTQQAKAKAGLQRSGGPGKAPPPDFTKMSDAEILAHEGLSLWTDD